MMTLPVRTRPIALLALSLSLIASFAHIPVSADQQETTPPPSEASEAANVSRCENIPRLMAEGSNSCEIMSCGMGIKDTCKITCPADKTPKCSCDCLKSFGPMCTEYKANCKCE